MEETERLTASAPIDTHDVLAADIFAIEDEMTESFRKAPPFTTVGGDLDEVPMRFRALVTHDENFQISLAEIVSPPPIDADSDGSDGGMGPETSQCMSYVNEASYEVFRATKSQREATFAVQSAQAGLPAAEAAVTVATDLAQARKGP